MQFDTLIIGGGIAGLSCAIRCSEQGQKVAVISAGQSALHFSSGAIDVLGQLPDGTPVTHPFESCAEFKQHFPHHPYAKLNRQQVKASLDWFETQLTLQGVKLVHASGEANHQRLTPLGALRSTYLSQPSSLMLPIDENPHHAPQHIVIATIRGYRDFQPTLLKENLSKHPKFAQAKIDTITLDLPTLPQPCEYRSIDIAHFLQTSSQLNALADQLQRHAKHADVIILPACVGNGDGQQVIAKLRQRCGLNLFEMPTMPPSLMGLRIEEALKRRLREVGGMLLNGDQVQQGIFDNGKVSAVISRNHDMPLRANHFVLASGSYFSRGLLAERKQIREPIFDLSIASSADVPFHDDFLSPHPHQFMQQGVTTNQAFQPEKDGKTVPNLFCAGAVLAHYDPVFEGSGSGVAISSGYAIAEHILSETTAQIDGDIA
ncbi:glycerol-3-phosphate dehydrogenase subunit GlpB [Thaumasiovibrio subtropicus]|uniref:glycerol-3-phosphate dehydrogenase subunit GlpB n=1 Tax=Thaumasiovibrio subtropicus TaxID=1891207 RepID=UPI000B35EAB4|nr:glycerol-3-phosphate dehydrogenase subunit GlpB [Thaumasiovibrio subtropicus]